MDSMASLLLNGNMDWMSLAGKMLSSLKERPVTEAKKRKTTAIRQIPPVSNPRPSRKPTAQSGVQYSAFPATKPSFATTASQFEALRMQLLRQLVIYQKQLMALKIPHIPEQFKTKKCVPNINDHLNDQLAELYYRNNSVLKGGKRTTVAETNPCNKKKKSKPKKTVKRNLKSKKATHDLNKQNNMSSNAEGMNACSSSRHFTRRILPSNMPFSKDKFAFNDMHVPKQCTYYNNNIKFQKCHNNNDNTCKKKKLSSKCRTKHGNSSLKNENQAVVNKPCVSNGSRVLYKGIKNSQ